MTKQVYKHCALALSVDALMAKARETTGIDIVDHDVVEPLTELHKSYNEDAALTEAGAGFVQKYLLRMLSNRLRMRRDFAAHPEIAAQKIANPIFICGMARTGSTKMQKLLASSGDFNWLPFWQSLNPASHTGIPNESPDARIRDTDDFVEFWNAVSPNAKYMHEFATHEPEEEYFLMSHSFRVAPVGVLLLPGYMQWLMRVDSMSYQLKYLRDTLKYLQWQGLASPSKRWVLKAPHYYGWELTIRDNFPDASFLEATTLVISDEKGDCSLFAGAAAYQINRQLDNRRTHGDLKITDIHYKELTRSAIAAAEKVYAFNQIALAPASRQRMLDWDNAHPIHAKGGHKYELADFGFSEDQINHDFAEYLEFMNGLMGESGEPINEPSTN
jgi:Sulfotransferase family